MKLCAAEGAMVNVLCMYRSKVDVHTKLSDLFGRNHSASKQTQATRDHGHEKAKDVKETCDMDCTVLFCTVTDCHFVSVPPCESNVASSHLDGHNLFFKG